MPWIRRLAVLTAVSTLALIAAGALVTSTDSGMAFPDWPTSDGHNLFAYPWFRAARAQFIEHGHRLAGAWVGLLTLALAFALWARHPSRGLKLLGCAAAALVVLQGVLGGMRVLLDARAVAFLHACLAQAFFPVTVALAALLSEVPAVPGTWRSRSVVGLVYLQMVTGAALRQLKAPVLLHLGTAFLVAAAALALALRVLGRAGHRPECARPAMALAALVVFQVSLGLASWLSLHIVPDPRVHASAVLHTVLHVVTASLVMGASVVLALRGGEDA